METAKKNCISCGACTKNCIFLAKYGLDFSKENELKQLAHHCMLCGKCSRVCPIKIDGRKRMLNMRLQNVQERHGKLNGYSLLRLEKNNYLFKNHKKAQKKSVLFPGCNYPSLYPKTLDVLISLLQKKGMGIMFDCCGKPIAELGLKKKEEAITARLNQVIQAEGIEEIVVLCPNCYYHLAGKIHVPIVSVYEKLLQFGLGEAITTNEEELHLFLPCPDKAGKHFLNSIRNFLPDKLCEIQTPQCCGLGGVAVAKEPSYPAVLASQLQSYQKDNHDENIYVYCASCAGSFKKKGVQGVHHVLSKILNTQEAPDIYRSLYNRVKYKWK